MEQGWEQAGPDVTLSQSVTMLLSRSPPLRCTALNVIFHFQMKDDPFDPYDEFDKSCPFDTRDQSEPSDPSD